MIDFFDSKHNPQSFSEQSMWLADVSQGAAYCTTDRQDSSCVTEVENKSQKVVTFVAVDHNIDFRINEQDDQLSRCDGMLHYENNLCFVELKNQERGGLARAKKQLISTINVFRQHHDVRNFRKKRAYICNMRHPYFYRFESEDIQCFRAETGGFKLMAENKILIK